MDWQIIAIWLIAGATIVWFLRSERNRRFIQLAGRARQFATEPAYRHHSVEPSAAPKSYVPTGLSASDRMFLEAIAKNARKSDLPAEPFKPFIIPANRS